MSTDDNRNDDPFDDRYRDEDRFDERFDSRQQPQETKQGMSTGMKVLIVLLCMGGGMFVLCCGGGIFFFSKSANSSTEDPREVIAITQDIVEITIPEQFVPQGGINLDIIFMQMKVAAYTSTSGDGMLMIMEMNVSGLTPEQQEPEIRKAMRQQMGNQNFGEQELDLIKTETRTFTIRGKEIDFKFAEAEDPNTKTAYRQVTGVFPGKGGTAFLRLQIEEEGYDENAVVKMIESIK
jgi:hypothetical protein